MIFMFQFRGNGGRWESLGTGEGRGRNAMRDAFRDLAALSGGDLPPGVYRWLCADRGSENRWRYFTLSPSGRILRFSNLPA